MDRRFALFAVLVALIFVVNQIVFSLFFPPPPAPKKDGKPVAAAKADNKDAPKANLQAPPDKPDAQDKAVPDNADPETPTKPADGDKAPQDDKKPAEEEALPVPLRGTLGSMDPNGSTRMLVTWNSAGAAIERIELNSPSYRSLDDRSGYLGYLAPVDAPKRSGALVRVVGPGTPAAAAGIERDDVITAVGDQRVRTAAELIAVLQQTEPGQQIHLSVKRSEEEKPLTVTLAHQPLDLIRAEWETNPAPIVLPKKHDPLSFLTTIQQYDDRTLANDDQELGGVNLRDGAWEVVQADALKVTFRRILPRLGLEITKIYTLATVPKDEHDNVNYPAYGLMLELRIANVDDKPHKMAYRLDGPTGLPIEGAWYASKVSHTWGGAGLRDVIVQFNGGRLDQVAPSQLADSDYKQDWGATSSLEYIAVDAQYFAAAMIPQKKAPGDIWFQSVMPRRAGAVPKEKADFRLMNVSCRLDSKLVDLAPGGPPLEHHFQIFAGPKRPALLAQYAQPGGSSLKDLVYYGWFGVVARPMLVVLHFFYSLVGNYGLAIIMLTVLVRGCMFPLGRKQALGAQKMQELQPEMKRIAEKYKTEPEKRTRATQELFRSHNYNPVGGCMLAFVQLPVFVGLYRSLMVAVDLRQAPLFTESIRWASNLAAPDMFWNWTAIMPQFITSGTGILGLGPYLNILPLVTIALFIWQQKMFMPPAADEQAALQQKMMQYMMIFMGVLFFKVASGLCVYFIASSLWGVGERKLLPKAAAKGGSAGTSAAVPAANPTTSGNGAPSGKKRQRGPK